MSIIQYLNSRFGIDQPSPDEQSAFGGQVRDQDWIFPQRRQR
jgi:hypothetical protein